MAKMRRTLGKKGMMTDFVADIFAFFLYVLSLLLFMMMFAISFGGCNNHLTPSNSAILTQANNGLGQEMLLLNYLRTSIISNGRSITFAELISQSCRDNDFDELATQTKELLDDEIHKNIIENSNSGLYKRPLVELYLECNPPKKGKLIYKTEKLPGCPVQIQCDPYQGASTTTSRGGKGYTGATSNPDQIKSITLPLPFREDDKNGNYARLIINSCEYTSTSLDPTVSSQVTQDMRDKCV